MDVLAPNASAVIGMSLGGLPSLELTRLAPHLMPRLVLVDITHPRMRPARDPLRSLVYAAGDRAVQAVYVDGIKVVEDGEVLTMDYRAAAAHLNEAQKRVEGRVPELDWAHRSAEQIAPTTFRWG